MKLLELQQKIVPEIFEVMLRRLTILQQIEHHQPIGRRTLAQLLGMTERVLRAEVELLRNQGLIHFQPSGMTLTDDGKFLIEQLYFVVHQVQGLAVWEKRLAQALGLETVLIVPGDSSNQDQVKLEMGRMAAHFLKRQVRETDCVAVTGGTSLAAMAEMMVVDQPYPQVTFLPARGGLGERVDIQANTVAARLAEKMGGRYLLLHVPDNLSEEAYRSLLEDPNIRERVEKIRTARLVFHGIGNAIKMAERRGAGPEVLEILRRRKAVSEAFGYYFNQNGEIVYQMTTMGLRLEDLHDKICIAVAGGSEKAEAIASMAKTGIIKVLITDEGAAKKILSQQIQKS